MMITKTVEPILSDCASLAGGNAVIGTKVEYRLFGILLYKKVLYTPNKYGVAENFEFIISY